LEKLAFTYNREMLNFLVRDKEIFYTDRKTKLWLRCLPPAPHIHKLIVNSRNKIPAFLETLFTFTKKEIKEYEAAKDEKELADIIIKDANGKGCRLVIRSIVPTTDIKSINDSIIQSLLKQKGTKEAKDV